MSWVRQGLIPGISHHGPIEEVGPEPYVNLKGKETVAYVVGLTNARLVAAAPELLEALRVNAETIHADVHMNSGGRDFRGCEIASCKRAAAAIAKATGTI